MFERRRARILLAALTLVSLLLITLDERAGDSSPLARVRDAVAAVFGPAQDGVATIVRPIGGVFDAIGDLFRLRENNARLEADLRKLSERRESYEDVVRENERLRALLSMRDGLAATSDQFAFRTAAVIGLAPSNFEWTITIDVGAGDGVRDGMTVVNGDGLVGRVIQVGPTAARVLLAVDPNFSAAARIARSREHGLVEGRDDDPMRLRLLDPTADVKVGDEVVTASYRHAIFPSGIPVGAVDSVGKAGTLAREALVRPYVDFTQLELVLVVLRQPPRVPLPAPTPPSPALPTDAPTAAQTPSQEPTLGREEPAP